MKKFLFITVSIMILISSCGSKEQASGPQSLMEASRQELITALEERDQLLKLVKEISISMDQIKHLEVIMTISEARSDEKPAMRAQILSDITAIQNTLSLRRKQLRELESRLRNSALYTDELKSTVDALGKQIKSQSEQIDFLRKQLTKANEKISTLNYEVDSLNSTVAEVNHNLDSAKAASIHFENELNTCYYVIASKSQLKEHHIIETGFLRKSKLMKKDFDHSFFSTGDKRNIKVIDLHSKKYKLLTNHPKDSYEISETNRQKILTILNPKKFWSLSNYLVIQTD